MTDEEIAQKVRDVLAKKLSREPADLRDETRLAEDLGLDSFAGVEIMFEIEEAFELKIADSDIQNVRTVGDIVAYIGRYKNAAS
jgi:acyl carrier protein